MFACALCCLIRILSGNSRKKHSRLRTCCRTHKTAVRRCCCCWFIRQSLRWSNAIFLQDNQSYRRANLQPWADASLAERLLDKNHALGAVAPTNCLQVFQHRQEAKSQRPLRLIHCTQSALSLSSLMCTVTLKLRHQNAQERRRSSGFPASQICGREAGAQSSLVTCTLGLPLYRHQPEIPIHRSTEAKVHRHDENKEKGGISLALPNNRGTKLSLW